MCLKRVGHGNFRPNCYWCFTDLGKATRLLQFLKQDKAYLATIQLGISTTTDDLEGNHRLSTSIWVELGADVSHLSCLIQQVPPSYSAIKVQGTFVRLGTLVKVEVPTVEVYKIEILDWRRRFSELDVQSPVVLELIFVRSLVT